MYRDRFGIKKNIISKKQTATKTNRERDGRKSKGAQAQVRLISVVEVAIVQRFLCDASPCEVQNGN